MLLYLFKWITRSALKKKKSVILSILVTCCLRTMVKNEPMHLVCLGWAVIYVHISMISNKFLKSLQFCQIRIAKWRI